MIVDGAGDQSSVVVKRGLILLEKVFEEREEVGRVLVCEEQRLRSAAVLQVVHAGGEFAGVSSGAVLISHGPSLLARVWRFMIFGRYVIEKKGEEKGGRVVTQFWSSARESWD